MSKRIGKFKISKRESALSLVDGGTPQGGLFKANSSPTGTTTVLTNSGGRLIMGIDFYTENIPSHSWPEDCSISIMKLFSEREWIRFFENAGFEKVKSWRHGEKDEWGGTLIVTGKVK